MSEIKDPTQPDSTEEQPMAVVEEENKGLSYEVRTGGGSIVITGGSQEELLRAALSIDRELDPSSAPNQSSTEYLLSSSVNELRPMAGIFAINFNKRNGELIVQNRNGRGIKKYNDQLLHAVEKVIG